MDISEVITLARSIAPLCSQNWRVPRRRGVQHGIHANTEGPIILIGAYDNPWTMRVTQDLPFGFKYDANHVRTIIDRKTAQKRSRSLQWDVPRSKLAQDYAIIARIHDNVTGQPMVVLAGILGQGTEAAGEVVCNPASLNLVLAKAPKKLDQMNLKAVTETNVIEGHAGPPTILAVETW